MPSIAYTNVLQEINALQQRIDTLRSMIREEVAAEEIPEGALLLLACRTDKEVVGILLRDVEEVLPMCAITPVPDAPRWLPGLLNLSGEMVPVVDLNVRIGGVPRSFTVDDFIVVCRCRDERVGLVVPEVLGVFEKPRGDLQPVTDRVTASRHLLGVSEIDGNPLLLLSLSQIFTTSEVTVEEL